ncbi:MAG: Ureidoglycolate hydrolase [Synechococcaceae cyanobacterium SM2_3_2]|nr:Ureidoglycolate hydrolase [Synechococcaceae cyanobacterium SM2_3_2]
MSTFTLRRLKAQLITPESFAPFGQIITATQDGKAFDQEDAQLVLDRGIPRFYLMRLRPKGLSFSQITRHRQCTQCLGSLGGHSWYLGVAPSSSDPLNPDQIVVFKIPGDCFIKLEVGTWHAGPHFQDPDYIDFYNLELSDTNLVDHDTINLALDRGMTFEIEI